MIALALISIGFFMQSASIPYKENDSEKTRNICGMFFFLGFSFSILAWLVHVTLHI